MTFIDTQFQAELTEPILTFLLHTLTVKQIVC